MPKRSDPERFSWTAADERAVQQAVDVELRSRVTAERESGWTGEDRGTYVMALVTFAIGFPVGLVIACVMGLVTALVTVATTAGGRALRLPRDVHQGAVSVAETWRARRALRRAVRAARGGL